MTTPYDPDPLHVPEAPVRRRVGRNDNARADAFLIAAGVIAILALWGVSTGKVAPTPTPTPISSPSAVLVDVAGVSASVDGKATWYHYHRGQAAAGPGLRKALGSGWRGSTVRVCHDGACITTRLTDWCLCGHGRVIDLDVRDFARLTVDESHPRGNVGAGVIPVTVTRATLPALPATDTE